jgi:hypothetical protein
MCELKGRDAIVDAAEGAHFNTLSFDSLSSLFIILTELSASFLAGS